jgi:FkbM family methyltransferase
VYSLGIGEEISFDLELIQRFDLHVHGFDPTPRSIEWIKQQNLPSQFVAHEFGVAEYDGVCSWFAPGNPRHVSHSRVERKAKTTAIQVPVRRITSIMHILGHSAIDLLKMDVEGAEYEILSDLIASRVPVNQLLVEFHHRWPEIGVERTRWVLRQLFEAGYRIFNVSSSGEEYSFIKS